MGNLVVFKKMIITTMKKQVDGILISFLSIIELIEYLKYKLMNNL